MTDIVERLRAEYATQDEHGTLDDVNADLVKDAANEIEALRADLDKSWTRA
jgi:hypothetical protein